MHFPGGKVRQGFDLPDLFFAQISVSVIGIRGEIRYLSPNPVATILISATGPRSIICVTFGQDERNHRSSEHYSFVDTIGSNLESANGLEQCFDGVLGYHAFMATNKPTCLVGRQFNMYVRGRHDSQ